MPNDDHPWEESGETELEYFHRRFLEESGRAEVAEARAAEAEAVMRAHLPSLRATAAFLQRRDDATVPAVKTQRLLAGIDRFLSVPPAAPPPDEHCATCSRRLSPSLPLGGHSENCGLTEAPAAPPEPPPDVKAWEWQALVNAAAYLYLLPTERSHQRDAYHRDRLLAVARSVFLSAPLEPSDPLEQAVLDAAERRVDAAAAMRAAMHTGDSDAATETLLAAMHELDEAVAALRSSRKEGQGG